jgi:hypothetical protein
MNDTLTIEAATPAETSALDAIHMLPLEIIPLQTGALQRALMIKNAKLETVLQLFEGKGMGSGQIHVADVRKSFPNTTVTDYGILQKLSKIPSYDVYSLRILLRDQGIPIDNNENLSLSEKKQRELNSYMRHFTGRLVQEIYGNDSSIRNFDDVIALFRSPDVTTAITNLKLMARKLHISLDKIPSFLEDYGDTYLSICYYRSCHDHIAPQVMGFLDSVDEILSSSQLAQDRMIVNNCTRTRAAISKMSTLVHGRLQAFDRRAEEVWENITAERFREFKEMVEGQHTAIGEMLCVLTVKLDAWNRKFPPHLDGGLYKRAEFITNEMQTAL